MTTPHDDPHFLRYLQQLHDDGDHAEILRLIDAAAPEAHTYTLIGLQARALNNLDREAEGLALLKRVAQEGENDPIWHYRVGYSLLYLNRREEALTHLRQAVTLAPEDEDAADLLQHAMRMGKFKKEK